MPNISQNTWFQSIKNCTNIHLSMLYHIPNLVFTTTYHVICWAKPRFATIAKKQKLEQESGY